MGRAIFSGFLESSGQEHSPFFIPLSLFDRLIGFLNNLGIFPLQKILPRFEKRDIRPERNLAAD
jgi:hypothetical protein